MVWSSIADCCASMNDAAEAATATMRIAVIAATPRSRRFTASSACRWCARCARPSPACTWPRPLRAGVRVERGGKRHQRRAVGAESPARKRRAEVALEAADGERHVAPLARFLLQRHARLEHAVEGAVGEGAHEREDREGDQELDE